MKELLLSVVRRIPLPLRQAPHAETRQADKTEVRFSSRRRRRLTWINQVCRYSR